MHISSVSLENIGDEVIIKMLQNARILNDRIVNFHNSQYCIDNSTLLHNITYDYCTGGSCKLMKDLMYEPCQYGCDYQLSVCKNPPYTYALWGFGGIVGFLAVIAGVLKMQGRI
jgi:hypothetical protein